MGAISLFRRFMAEEDHVKFMRVIESMEMQAMADGFKRNEDGSYLIEGKMPVLDLALLHPNCHKAQQAFLEYTIGKAVQPVDIQGGTGGARLLFNAEMIEKFGLDTAQTAMLNEYGEEEVLVIDVKRNGHSNGHSSNGNGRA
jgi:hypothetical protein